MADVTLSGGRAVTFDLYKVTIRERDRLIDPAQPIEEEYITIAKAAGMSVDEIKDLPLPDYKRITKAFVERCRDPLAGEESG